MTLGKGEGDLEVTCRMLSMNFCKAKSNNLLVAAISKEY